MPRKLHLSYKKHGSVWRKSLDVQEEVDEAPTTGTLSTQTDSVEISDVGVQTAQEPPCDEFNLLTPLKFSATVKVNIEVFYSLKIVEINQLAMRLSSMKSIFSYWCLIPSKLQADKLQLVRFGQQQAKCSFMIEILKDLKWSLQLPCEKPSPATSLVLQHLPECVTTLQDLRLILKFLDQCTVCQGNPDPKFAPIVSYSKGILKDRSGKLLMFKYIYIATCSIICVQV